MSIEVKRKTGTKKISTLSPKLWESGKLWVFIPLLPYWASLASAGSPLGAGGSRTWPTARGEASPFPGCPPPCAWWSCRRCSGRSRPSAERGSPEGKIETKWWNQDKNMWEMQKLRRIYSETFSDMRNKRISTFSVEFDGTPFPKASF